MFYILLLEPYKVKGVKHPLAINTGSGEYFKVEEFLNYRKVRSKDKYFTK